MKPLGRVRQVKKNKLIIQLKYQNLPKIGEDVFDDRENFVGNITDFFGPTKNPYIVISTKHSVVKYNGKDLFY